MITIQGVGIISPWGESDVAFKESYLARKNTLEPKSAIDRFETDQVCADEISLIKEFNPKDYIKPANLRRYDKYSRIGISTVKQILDSAPYALDRSELGLVATCGTQSELTEGFLADIYDHGPEYASPRKFPSVSANSISGNISIEFGLEGSNVTVDSKFASGLPALYSAINLIRAGHMDNCLAVSMDYFSKIYLDSLSRMKAYKWQGSTKGFSPGENAMGFLLSNRETGGYGKIHSISFLGSNTDNYRWPTDWETQVRAHQKTMGSKKIDNYYTAANGDTFVEEIETKTFAKLFGESATQPKLINLKSLVGESGALPLVQVFAACCEPAGTKSLISVIGTGGLHGSILVEANDWQANCERIAV